MGIVDNNCIFDERAKRTLPFWHILQCFFSLTQLHPMDAYFHTENLTTALEGFTNAFKDRIEA